MRVLQTPFARALLPRFGTWLSRILEQEQPDYIVPVERKGAHLLDAVLAHLALHQSTPVRAAILYRRALAYVDKCALDGAKVLVLDDASHIGKTLHSYRDEIAASGNPQIKMLACLGLALPTNDPAKKQRADISCFLELPEDEYHEYLYQISELVVARGFTPEVDHHQFRLRTGSSLVHDWPLVLSALSENGILDVHGPLEIDTGTHGATLHWPTFLSKELLPDDGVVRRNGVIKLRLFADFDSNVITAIPLVYPELLLRSDTQDRSALIREFDAWEGSTAPLVRVVLENASRLSPEVLFHAASLRLEVELVRSLCKVLRERLPADADVSVVSERASLLRLYGPSLAPKLAEIIDAGFQQSSDVIQGGSAIESSFDVDALAENNDAINVGVNKATDQLLLALEREYLSRNEGKPRCDWETVGFGFSELKRLSPFCRRSDGPLLLSRCIDLGCATTGLVPFTTSEIIPDGRRIILRKYRTAETVHAATNGIEDFRGYQKGIAAETIAVISQYLSRRSTRWKNRATPLFVLDKIVAILHGAAPSFFEQGALTVVPQEHGPEVAFAITPLVGRPSYELVRSVSSDSYSVSSDGGIAPTETFLKRYKEGSLRIARRGEVLSIESYLQSLLPVLDDARDVTELLTCWAVSASGRLGLDYVMADVELAIASLQQPVDVMLGRRELIQSRLLRSCDRAIHLLGVALHEKLEPLITNWADPVVTRWSEPVAVESALLQSLGCPTNHLRLFSVATVFVDIVRDVSKTLRRFEALSVGEEKQPTLFGVNDADPRTALRSILTDRLNEIGEKLISWRDRGSQPQLARGDDLDQNSHVADWFKRIIEILSRFTSAFAWNYSRLVDWRKVSLPDSSPRNRAILFADLAGSTPAALALPHEENVRWKNNGLDLVAQWGQAFGGREGVYTRKGDDICLEFSDPHSAILCGAIVQEHLAALRSTKLRENTYVFRIAIDSSWISSADGGNLIGVGIDRAAKLAKAKLSDDPGDHGRLLVTPEVVRDCSDLLRSFLVQSADTLTLGDGERGVFSPSWVQRHSLIDAYVQGLRAICASEI